MFSSSFKNQLPVNDTTPLQVSFGQMLEDNDFILHENGDIEIINDCECRSITAWNVGRTQDEIRANQRNALLSVYTTTQNKNGPEKISGIPINSTVFNMSISDTKIIDSQFKAKAGDILRLYVQRVPSYDNFGGLVSIERSPSATIFIERQ